MNWRKIDDVEGLDEPCNLLFVSKTPHDTDYYLGWVWCDGTIKIEDSINRDFVNLDIGVKYFGITHYCIITPPEE